MIFNIDDMFLKELAALKENSSKIAIMAIGIPASGKTTFFAEIEPYNFARLSTDAFYEDISVMTGFIYDDIFEISALHSLAKKALRVNLDSQIHAGRNLYWDQTNLTKKSRSSKLALIPSEYKKIAMVFPIPQNLKTRLDSRPGKTIPQSVIYNMINSYEEPATYEGFDAIMKIEANE